MRHQGLALPAEPVAPAPVGSDTAQRTEVIDRPHDAAVLAVPRVVWVVLRRVGGDGEDLVEQPVDRGDRHECGAALDAVGGHDGRHTLSADHRDAAIRNAQFVSR